MSNEIRSLAVVDTTKAMILPPEGVLAEVVEELSDMDRIPMGRIQIAGGGAGVFNVTEPGADEAEPVKDVTGVILMSHACNAYWASDLGSSEDKSPDCMSMDGETGIVRESGEMLACRTCPYNQYGSANGGQGKGKACKNMRRLYILRPGDVLPMVFSLPPTALKAFDMYRTRLTLGMKRGHSVLTKISLTKAQSSGGIAYSTPKFEAVAALPLGEVERVRAYGEVMVKSAQRAGITSDDYMAATADSSPAEAAPSAPEAAPVSKPAQSGFMPIDADELPGDVQ